MTHEERKKYFKFYRGEEFCPTEWCGEPQGVIWGAERNIEADWEKISSGKWDESYGYAKRPLEETIEDFVVSTAQKFDPFNWAGIAEFYRTTQGRED